MQTYSGVTYDQIRRAEARYATTPDAIADRLATVALDLAVEWVELRDWQPRRPWGADPRDNGRHPARLYLTLRLRALHSLLRNA